MGVGKTVLQGSTVSKNALPQMPERPALILKGEFNGRPAYFGVDEDLISKHMLLVGGTGCGKSTSMMRFPFQAVFCNFRRRIYVKTLFFSMAKC